MTHDPLNPFRPECGIPAAGPLVAAKTEIAFSSCGPALLFIEARDLAAAQKHFEAVQQAKNPAATSVIELWPGLFFARAQSSGHYWSFRAEPPATAGAQPRTPAGPKGKAGRSDP